MESDNRGLDLEKELTCSICTEVLYQPLTLLDCLHTFCGACLKEWFSWQLSSMRNSPTSVPAGSTPFTCPSCRASVRDTKHNATVTTLLDMFLAANPEKVKSDQEKEELLAKYKLGENVLPKVDIRDKSLRERRIEDADRRLMNEVRDLSLREVGVESPEARRERRRREEGRSHSSRVHSSRENSRDSRNTDDRERRRRREGEAERRQRDDATATLRPSTGSEPERRRRRSDGDSRRRNEESRRTAARQIEHQSSLRSLISSSDVDSHEMEEEILRQIREEGLLDGIDLENIDVNQEDQISERIAEAFRRRQEERARQESARRIDASGRRRRAVSESRDTSGDDAPRTLRTRRTHSRSTSAVSQGDERSRPPISSSATHAAHLEAHSSDEGRRRRRATSSRSATTPTPRIDSRARPAARSQTDLSERPRTSQNSSASRPLVTPSSRSNTDPSVQRSTEVTAPEQSSRESRPSASNNNRSRANTRPEGSQDASSSSSPRPVPPEIFVPLSVPSAVSMDVDRSLMPEPLSPRAPSHSRDGSLSDRASAISSGSRPTSSSSTNARPHKQLYPEPSISCSRCSKPHIEYELHYNCNICAGGTWNICLACYRKGSGCLHWFGFGYAAWIKLEKLSQSGELKRPLEAPHMLTANRYIHPRVTAGGADGRRTLTTDDPQNRLQSGAFCANCSAWANECYWRCDVCNEGDWGFCNPCVNQGKSCSHSLLPLTYKPTESYAPPISPTDDNRTPATATILTGPGVIDVGPFKPLTFSTKCDICRYPIQPSTTRYHCFSCTSAVPGTLPGDYDICTTCYPKLVSSRRISVENGQNGWRRCLQGHRMVIVGFEDNRGGQRRVVVQDLVGGWKLHTEAYKSDAESEAHLQRWSWVRAGEKRVRLVTLDVAKTAPTSSPGMTIDSGFPPNGGIGMSCVAQWSWYPNEGTVDELMFPRGAEVREVENVNNDWFQGTYMGSEGLFPAPFVRVLD
ncbi:RING finger domain-containing protein [Phlyctema vagabunda]|uniref:RING finger domain-containing protein n=1 Tax=Phlyctema vagabunda TaxID=108571 RepID=A0ABR4PQW9_9HELO